MQRLKGQSAGGRVFLYDRDTIGEVFLFLLIVNCMEYVVDNNDRREISLLLCRIGIWLSNLCVLDGECEGF